MTDREGLMRFLDQRWRSLVHGESFIECNGCTGCCRAGYVIGLSKTEAKRIPHTRIGGHAVIMPGPDGVCPLLRDGKCSIYAQRPRECREYDCRDLAFAGILFADHRRAEINAAVARHMAATGVNVRAHQMAAQLVAAGRTAEVAAGAAVVAAFRDLLPPAKTAELLRRLQSPDAQQRRKACQAGSRRHDNQRAKAA